MKKSLWILNHYSLPPDLPGGTRHFELARELVSMGHDVTIIASAFNHKRHERVRLLDGAPWALEEVEGVKFVWVPSFAYQRNDWRRMVNMLDYAQRAYRLGRRLPEIEHRVAPPDYILGCTVHHFTVLASYYLSRHYRSRFLVEVRDLWPQTFIDMGLWREGQIQVRFFRWLEQYLYARAERIVVLSPLTRDYLAHYSSAWAEKAFYLPNGAPVGKFQQAGHSRQPGTGPLQAMFLGAIGCTNGVDLILKAMRIVESTEPGLLKLTLVGGGPEKQSLQKMAQEWELESVEFQGPVPREQVPEWTARADILVLVQRKVLYGSSNKLFDYLASGKPIVFSVFAQHNNLADEIGCGVAASPGDPEDLAAKLIALAKTPAEERRLMGERGLRYVREHHDYAVLAKRMEEMLEGMDEEPGAEGVDS